MKKINCNIIKDLMVPYLDGICSEETRMLVDEHMKVCGECRKFLEIIRTEDMSAETLKLRHLKKMNFVMKMRLFMIFLVPLVLCITVFCETVRMYRGEIMPVQIFYLIEMPILMVSFYIAFSENKKFSFEKSKIFSVVSVTALLFISLVGAAIIIFKGNIPIKPENAYSFVKISCIGVILTETLSLVFHALCEKKKGSFLLQSFAWFGLDSAMMLMSVMSCMSDMHTLVHRLSFGYIMLLTEFIAVNLIIGRFEKNTDSLFVQNKNK